MAASQNAKSIAEVSCISILMHAGDFRDALCVLAGSHLHYMFSVCLQYNCGVYSALYISSSSIHHNAIRDNSVYNTVSLKRVIVVSCSTTLSGEQLRYKTSNPFDDARLDIAWSENDRDTVGKASKDLF